jgi:hypothetical protein
MNDMRAPDRDVNRAIRSWLHEDRHEDASRIAGAVLDRVEATPQRRADWLAWRTPTMNRSVAIGLGAAAVVIAGVFLGAQLFGSPNGPVPGSSASPTPTATFTPTFDLAYAGDPISITVTIPPGRWYGARGSGFITIKDGDPPDGAGIITFEVDARSTDTSAGLYVYGDPCHWSTTRPDAPATTVDELVAALSAQSSREASAPVDITIDGHAGKSMTLHVPDDANFAACDSGEFASWGTAAEDPARWAQGPGQIDRLWILNVDGDLVVIDAGHYAGTPQDVLDGLDVMINSVTFAPASAG